MICEMLIQLLCYDMILQIMILSVGENSGCIENCLVVVDCDGAAVISYNVMSELLFILGCNNNQEYNLAHISLASRYLCLLCTEDFLQKKSFILLYK